MMDAHPVTGWEEVACNLCGGTRAALLFRGRDRLCGIKGEFCLVQCRTCGLIFLNPRPGPDAMAVYYPQEYLAYEKTNPADIGIMGNGTGVLARMKNRVKQAILGGYYGYPAPAGGTAGFWTGIAAAVSLGTFRRMYERTIPFVPGGRVLDIGCGNAAYLAWLKQLGWQVAGVELDKGCVEHAARAFGIDVFRGRLEESHFAPASFHCITMWHFLEHAHDPSAVLRECFRLLKDSGSLVIGLPNCASLEARLLRERSVLFDMPRHLYAFTPRTIRRLLEMIGFTDVRIRYGRSAATVDWSLNTWLCEAGKTWRIDTGLRQHPLVRLGDRLLAGCRLSSTMVLSARKTKDPV